MLPLTGCQPRHHRPNNVRFLMIAASVAWMLQCLTIGLVSWVFVGAAILFSWLDWRELRRRGVPVPFHWAWALLALAGAGLAVYVIGRTVVLLSTTSSTRWRPFFAGIRPTHASP